MTHSGRVQKQLLGYSIVRIFGLEIPTNAQEQGERLMKTRKPMARIRFTLVAALAVGGALAIGPAQAAVQGGADALRAASENGSITEQAQYRWGGYDYCWADDGW